MGETKSFIFPEIQLEACPAEEKPVVIVCVGQQARPGRPELLGGRTANTIGKRFPLSV